MTGSNRCPSDVARTVVLLICFCSSLLTVFAQTGGASDPAAPQEKEDPLFQVGEELTYNVSYASIDIGQVRIRLVDRLTNNDRLCYKATAYIDSYRGIPFVDLHAIYESVFDSRIYSIQFQARVKDGDHWNAFTYNFDYPGHRVLIDQGIWKSTTFTRRDTLTMDTLAQDGLSLFFYARSGARTPQRVNLMTVANEKKGTTYIDFPVERMKEEIDAVDYPLDVVHFTGEAKFVGVFGLTGGFEGWFSNDEARVPILAKMKVLIGNVRIELMKWNREKWMPPRYHEEEKH